MSIRYPYGQGNSAGRAKRIREMRRMRQHLSVTDERDMGVRVDHGAIFGLTRADTDFRWKARAWFQRCPF